MIHNWNLVMWMMILLQPIRAICGCQPTIFLALDMEILVNTTWQNLFMMLDNNSFHGLKMVVLGLHGHWFNGIDYMGQSYNKLEMYKNLTSPIVVCIIFFDMYGMTLIMQMRLFILNRVVIIFLQQASNKRPEYRLELFVDMNLQIVIVGKCIHMRWLDGQPNLTTK